MLKTQITDEEKEHFIETHAKKSALVLVRHKSHAVLMWSNGVNDMAVADVVGRSERQVSLWRRAWDKCRMASILTSHSKNSNAAKLTQTPT